MGSMGAFVLETRGLREFIYPKRRNLGKLFFPKHHNHELFADRFQRISELGLSKYILDVSLLKSEDISELIILPTFNETIQHLFEDVGLKTQTTHKSLIFEQTINLFGGVNEIDIIASKEIFELLVSLTPTVRTEKIAKKLIETVGVLEFETGSELLPMTRN